MTNPDQRYAQVQTHYQAGKDKTDELESVDLARHGICFSHLVGYYGRCLSLIIIVYVVEMCLL